MREIKFRAYDPVNKVMEYDVNVNQGKPVKRGYQWFDSGNTVHRSELMQFTGLKDKHGEDVYEGDIVYFGGKHIVKFGEFGVPNIEDEEYQDHAVGFYFQPAHYLKNIAPFNMTIPLNEIYSKQAEVIGNIYEHSHLLEQPNAN